MLGKNSLENTGRFYMATGTKKSTEEVLKHHVQALIARDIDSIATDYASDAVIFSPYGISKGKESIKNAFKAVLGMLTPEAMANMKTIKQDIDGEYVYVIWSAMPAISFGSDTLRIHDGKIVMQSFVGQPGS
jgi:ketosteroid isomerase-like protein